MIVIISPAKKMNIDEDGYPDTSTPQFINEAEYLTNQLKNLDYDSLKKLWVCNEKIATINYERLKSVDLKRNLTIAILAYHGIQYKYMAPNVFDNDQLDYVKKHLRILSGLYGLLRPLDGVVPYRLEMQAKFAFSGFENLYQFWGDKIQKQICLETDTIINLASKEYSKGITDFLPKDVKFINCVFGEIVNGKLIEKGTLCKMARGEMVRFMAENKINNVNHLKEFDRLDYTYSTELSVHKDFVFIKKN